MNENNLIVANTFQFALNIQRLFVQAVANAQKDNREKGLPNAYSINGTIILQFPNGDIVQEKPNP